MAIVNQLVTEFLFKGSTEKLEAYNKSLEESRNKLSELKKAQKDFNNFYKEEEQKLKKELKNIKSEDFVSERTKKLQQALQEIKSKYSGATRVTHKRYLEKQEARISDALDKSKERDKINFQRARKSQEKVIDQTVKNQKKTAESFKIQTEVQEENIKSAKEQAREEKNKMNSSVLALGRFTLAVSAAGVALKTIANIYNKFVQTNAQYLGAETGGDLSTKQLQGMAMSLRGLGVTTGKKELTGILGKANWQANLKRVGQNMNAQNLVMAGINPSNADTVSGLLSSAYKSFLAGTQESLLANALSSSGLPADQILNAFKVAKSRGMTPSAFEGDLFKTRAGVGSEVNVRNLGATGQLNQALDAVTGKGGELLNNPRGIIKATNPIYGSMQTLSSILKMFSNTAQPQQAGNVNYQSQNTYNIYTNNLDGLGNLDNNGLDLKILQLNSGGY